VKRASYRHAGSDDDEREVASYTTTVLVADLFGTTAEAVARDVMRVRDRERRAREERAS